MALPARKFEAEGFMQETTVLEERVGYLQGDVADMKGRIVKLGDKVDTVKDSVAALRTDLTAAIGSVRTELTAAIGAVRTELIAAIANARPDLTKDINSVQANVASLRADLNAVRAEIKQANLTLIMWMIGTMLALATLAFGIGRYVTLPAHSVTPS